MHTRLYIKSYPAETGNKITVDHLLRHSSGLQQDIGDFPSNSNKFPDIVAKVNEEFFSLTEQVEIISKRQLLFEPGTQYSYSSDGYAVLGSIIEKVTSLDYTHILESLIQEWDIANISNLSGKAEKARDYLMGLPERFKRISERGLKAPVEYQFNWIT